MTYALLLGCKRPKAPKGKSWHGDSKQVGDDWVYEKGLLETYEPDYEKQPKTDEDGNVVGYFVAVGASGKPGVPYLDGPVALDAVASDERYKLAHARAEAAWKRFTKWAAEQGVKLDYPRLYLVETEVA